MQGPLLVILTQSQCETTLQIVNLLIDHRMWVKGLKYMDDNDCGLLNLGTWKFTAASV